MKKFKEYLYAAYGSNLNLEQMKYRCPDAEFVGTAIIPNCTLIFKSRVNNCGVLDIAKCPGIDTPVGLFKITTADEKSLDRYEGYPSFYTKKKAMVKFMGEEQKVMFYAMNKNNGCSAAMPSLHYYHTVIQGYIDTGLDVSFICARLNDTTAKIT